MDYLKESVDNAQAASIEKHGLAAFGISLQGASHLDKDPPVPCQDAHAMRWLENQGVLIAAIADGVGSCPLSHWGAHTAVETALNTVEQELSKISMKSSFGLKIEDPDFRQKMKKILQSAFSNAQAAVEKMSEDSEPRYPVYVFQSTLTLAVYDGKTLMFGHVGDDGIVAQRTDGSVAMVTCRIKGEEANSVYPLQSAEECRQFGAVTNVAGFLMATDGILDAFVDISAASPEETYFNGVYYPFMQPAVYNIIDGKAENAEDILNSYKEWLMSEEYRKKVTDDMTLVAVVNQAEIKRSVRPEFSEEIWQKTQHEKKRNQQNALYKNWNSRKAGTLLPPEALPPLNEQSQPENPTFMTDPYPETDLNVSDNSDYTREGQLPEPYRHRKSAVSRRGKGSKGASKKRQKKRRACWKAFMILLLLLLILCSILVGFILGHRHTGQAVETESIAPGSEETQSPPQELPLSPKGGSAHPERESGTVPQETQISGEDNAAPQETQAPDKGAPTPQSPQIPVGSKICRGSMDSCIRCEQIFLWYRLG